MTDPARERAEKWLAEKMRACSFFTFDTGIDECASIAAGAIAKVVAANNRQWSVLAHDVSAQNMMAYGEDSELHRVAVTVALEISGAGYRTPLPWHAIEEQ